MAASDQDKLDEAKERYLEAKQDIEDFRLKIAHTTCPFSNGDVVSVMRGDRLIKFVVEHIWYATDSSVGGELLNPVVGAATGWTVSGPKIRKSDGKPGKHQSAINSLDFHLEGDVWVQHKPTLSEILGVTE
ncbi:hypothetical protein [Antarctobacter sp.]|uniref:hypothetical protein n=1 Tax=Antarctobacter sp. TaxID=1872577 RepID=UPI002B266575|nr:hypothetical protein [Antarctobacter sp.]